MVWLGSSRLPASIDTSFDFRSDTPNDGDPDALSPTLRQYHRLLWGRPLPSGEPFDLDASSPIRSRYLHHASGLGEFHLASDSVVPSFTRWKRMQHIVGQLTEVENEAFRTIGYTIGGMMVWPRRSSNGLRSINVERGFNRSISDRLDLTLECVRRFYLGEASPMSLVLDANEGFFGLFGSFRGFVNHFMLEDLVSNDYTRVGFFLPFLDFVDPSVPQDLDSYLEYRGLSIEFIRARNVRIREWARTLSARG